MGLGLFKTKASKLAEKASSDNVDERCMAIIEAFSLYEQKFKSSDDRDLAMVLSRDSSFDKKTQHLIHKARKRRNDIVHHGYRPSRKEAKRIMRDIDAMLHRTKTTLERWFGN